MARHLGADAAIDPDQVDSAQEIVGSTGGRGVDCAIDCAAKEHTTNWAIRSLVSSKRPVESRRMLATAASTKINATPAIIVQGPKGQAQPLVGDYPYSDVETAIKSVS